MKKVILNFIQYDKCQIMRIALFSDIHANLPALEAFFKDLDTRKVDQLYCLGDLVGYNIWPNEVIQRNPQDEIFQRLLVIMILVLEEQVMIVVVLIRLIRKKPMGPYPFHIPIRL